MYLDKTISKAVRSRLDKTHFWVDANETHHHTEHMPQGYALNVILWLDERAGALYADAVLDAFHAGEPLPQGPALVWLRNTPLVRALVRKLDTAHLLALGRGEPACQRCGDFIEGQSFKVSGQPGPLHSWCKATLLAAHTIDDAKTALSKQVAAELVACHQELQSVPGTMNHIRDLDKLRDIVLSLETAATSDILVLGVFLATSAERALSRFATTK